MKHMLKDSTVLKEDLDRLVFSENINFDKLRNSNILITGITGLIGSMLARSLIYFNVKKKLNINIYGVVRNIDKLNSIYNEEEIRSLHILCGDVLQDFNEYMDEKIKLDYIFHAASITSSRTMIMQPIKTIITSVDGTNNILRMAHEKEAKSVVYISSMEMYGNFLNDNLSGENCTEEKLGYIDPLKVRSNYPESKRMCENLCVAYASELNVPVKIARLSQTFGAGILPWETRVFAQFAKSVIKNENIVLHTTGKSEGNYCYLTETIEGLFIVLLNGENAEAYNVSNEETHTTIEDMAQLVCSKIADGRIKVIFDIPQDNVFGYAAETKLKLNSEKLRTLGWKPKIGLEEMYFRTIKYLREQL